jgi:acyl-CoA thioesterase-2
VASFAAIMTLRDRGEDRFGASGAGAPWGWLYGGEVASQALRAAAATVAPDRPPNSLHCSFLRAGADGIELELAIERVRDGRAFSVRRVLASQAGKLIAIVTLSFHVVESSEDLSLTSAPAVPAPEALESTSWSRLFERRYAPVEDLSRTLNWVRLNEPLPDDPVLQACALIYVTDDLFDGPPVRMLGEALWRPEEFLLPERELHGQSLEFGLWLHRPVRPDDWLLLDYRVTTLTNGCATVNGEVFDRSGTHVATVTQQILVRRP